MNSELPLSLYKANTELQLQITRLLQEASHRWLEAAHELSTEGIAETTAQIQGLLGSGDWQAATTLPAETFWRLLQGRLTDAQSVNQVAMKSQAAFADGVRQALAHWQGAVGAAFGVDADHAAFARLYQQWVQPWAAAQAPAGKTRK
jgi:hypothetical protein